MRSVMINLTYFEIAFFLQYLESQDRPTTTTKHNLKDTMCCLSYRVVYQDNVFSTALHPHPHPQRQLMSGEQGNLAHVVVHVETVSQSFVV